MTGIGGLAPHTPLLATEADILRADLPPSIREARLYWASLMAELSHDDPLYIAAANCDDADARAMRGHRG